MKYLVDTNVLLRYFDQDDPNHSMCVSALRTLTARGEEPSLCAQVMIEYWVVASRPAAANGLGLDPDKVHEQLSLACVALLCLPEPPDMAEKWRDLAGRYSVKGRQAHDARIAALMLAHGVTHILTLNPSDFARYEGITPVTPQDILQ